MKLDELAKLAGVSRTTASYVVNGKAKQYRVSDKTIEKVESLIKQYDFKPNAMAAGLRVGKSYTIGLIIPDFENQSYAKIASLLENRFREQGYQLLISCSNDNPENEMAAAKHLFGRQIDALIVSTALPMNSNFYQEFQQIPVFGFDRCIDTDHVHNVISDDETDAYNLAKQLFAQPYQQVLFLGALPELTMSKQREAGFRRALNEYSQNVDFLYTDHFHQQQAAQYFSQWLDKNNLPEGIFTTSLTLLQGVLQVLLKRYKKIPPDLVIATFGHHEMLDLIANKSICCVQNHESVAENLFTLVMNKLQKKKDELKLPTIHRQLFQIN